MKTNKTRVLIASLFATIIIVLTGCGGNVEDVTMVNNTMAKESASVVSFERTDSVSTMSAIVVEDNTVFATESGVSNKIIYSNTDEQIINNVKFSNIEFNPNYYGRTSGTWRWTGDTAVRISVYIPTPRNEQERDYAAKVKVAIKLINTKLENTVVLEEAQYQPSTKYIHISYNTSYVPAGFTDYISGAYCANVSSGRNIGNPIMPDWNNGVSTSVVFINLGNGKCNLTQDVVTHEFGHALGLANHFDGFGIGAVISDEYWDTLATLYNNKPATKEKKLIVKRALKTIVGGGEHESNEEVRYCERRVHYETAPDATQIRSTYEHYRC